MSARGQRRASGAAILRLCSIPVLVATLSVLAPGALDARQASAATGAAVGSEGLTTVIVVRHAERAPGNDDPGLSEAGAERGRTLAWMLQGVDVSAIYSTPYNRTRETVGPLAEQLGLDLRIENPGAGSGSEADGYRDFAHRIVREHRGGVVAIAGHSNTVGAIVTAFGVGEVEELSELEYDHLFIVTLSEVGQGTLLRLRFGEANPPLDP